MNIRLLGFLPLLAGLAILPACDDQFDCANDGVCDQIEQTYGVDDFHIEGRQSRVFTVDATEYELVHFEYGQGNDCASGCFYSHLCTVVVNGEQDYPLGFAFTSEQEALVDPYTYCADFTWMGGSSSPDCDMPAFDLPLMGSTRFRNWALYPEDENDEMRWCRTFIERYMTRPR